MHLALTLLPNLQSTHHSRLVLQSSDLHRGAPPNTNFASISEINTDVGPAFLYNRTKLAQILFVLALQRRMEAGELGFSKDNVVYVNAVHPGGVNTDQPKQAQEAYGKFVEKVAVPMARTMMKDPIDEGCRPALFAAASDHVIEDKVNGKYVSKHHDPACNTRVCQVLFRNKRLTTCDDTDCPGPQNYLAIV